MNPRLLQFNEDNSLKDRELMTSLSTPAVKPQKIPTPGGGVQLFVDTVKNIPSTISGGLKTLGKTIAPSRTDIIGQIQQERQQTLLPSEARKLAVQRETEMGLVRAGDSGPLVGIDAGAIRNVGKPLVKNLTTQFLEYAKGKNVLSRQEIMDFARRPELKKGEADLLNNLAKDLPNGKVSAKDFTDSIRRDLLELTPVKVKDLQYRRVRLGQDSRELGKNYEEVVFESPITTNGSSHFPNSKNYFAHARGDEVVEGGKKIWREQEIQSDLLQKGTLDRMIGDQTNGRSIEDYKKFAKEYPGLVSSEIAGKNIARAEEFGKLDPFTNDRFGERIMRERIKAKAEAGYDKYRLPTGETIGKIEGFESPNWQIMKNDIPRGRLKIDNLKVGLTVYRGDGATGNCIITDILGDGRFKAVPKIELDRVGKTSQEGLSWIQKQIDSGKWDSSDFDSMKETFDLTGKNNPQYRRYENWGKFLKNKYGAKIVTDTQGNTWYEADISGQKDKPVFAFGKAQTGAIIGVAAVTAAPILGGQIPGKSIKYEREKPKLFKEVAKPLEGEWKGTNYDPLDPWQNRPFDSKETHGIGAAGVKIDESMVAVPRKKDGVSGMLRLGTVIYVPELDKKFLVADLKNSRFNGQKQIDFATVGTSTKIQPEYNKNFSNIVILRDGKGYKDLRDYVNSGEWEKDKKQPFKKSK